MISWGTQSISTQCSEIIVSDVVFLHLDPVLALLLLALELEALLQQRRHLLLGDDALAGQVVHGEAVPDLLLAVLDWEWSRFEMFRTNTPRVKVLLTTQLIPNQFLFSSKQKDAHSDNILLSGYEPILRNFST